MADVLIRGMEMPKNCNGCLFSAMNVHWKTICIIGGTYSDTEPSDNCPLVEVPDHGRLIDADEEIEVCTTQGAFPISKTTVSKFLLGHCIGKIPPTVIPASGKETQ